MHRLIAPLVLLLSLAVPAKADDSPYPPVDPEADVIQGGRESPVTMLVYVSPGCIHCLDLMSSFASPDIGGLLDGRVRVVVRELPSFLPPPRGEISKQRRRNGQTLSLALAVASHCMKDAKPGAVLLNWRFLGNYVDRFAVGEDGVRFWPYLDTEQATRFSRRFRSDEWQQSDVLETCYADAGRVAGIRERIAAQTRAFVEAAPEGTALPVVLLDGEPYEWSRLVPLQRRRDDLKNALAVAVNEGKAERYEQCRHERFLRDHPRFAAEQIPDVIAGINDPSARPPGLPRSLGYWMDVSDSWQMSAMLCARHKP